MRSYRCSFCNKDYVEVVANSASSAAKIYADERVNNFENVMEFLKSSKDKVYVNVFNESDILDEGWFLVEYTAVIICYAEKSKPPEWSIK